jgi:two-component system phosphate regulon sensor histidine kinase PhoR
MGAPIRVRLFIICFLLIAGILAAVDVSSGPGAHRTILELTFSLLGAIVITWIFSAALAWRIQRLQRFADNVLNAGSDDSALPEEGRETTALNQSLRRMALRIRELVERLSEESARRDAILKSMAEGVLAVDHQMRVLFCNQAFSTALGLRQPVEEDTPIVGLVRDPRFLALISGVLNSGEPVKTRFSMASGEASVFEAYAAPLAIPTGRGVLLILHDITGLERLERIRRDFVANVSHELRTPLTAIRGYAETLLAGALDDGENNRRFVEIIQAHAIRLNNIASDLLTLSDLESGRRDSEAGPISIEEAINTALLTVEAEARIRNVNLVRGGVRDAMIIGHAIRLNNIASDLLTLSDLESGRRDSEAGPISIEEAINTALLTVEAEARIRNVNLVRGGVRDAIIIGHAIRLEQALVNLLDNAVKFNKPGGEVRIDAMPGPDGRILISVADTGSGIPSDDLPRIFERFYRVDKARSREVGGTGLGLSIVKHVVERMEGTIKVDSRLGKGSVFTISLPPAPGSLAA